MSRFVYSRLAARKIRYAVISDALFWSKYIRPLAVSFDIARRAPITNVVVNEINYAVCAGFTQETIVRTEMKVVINRWYFNTANSRLKNKRLVGGIAPMLF